MNTINRTSGMSFIAEERVQGIVDYAERRGRKRETERERQRERERWRERERERERV